MFVLSHVGPTFDLETKKNFFCRVSDYALSDSGNRFSQFGLFHTVLKRHFSVRRSNLRWPRDPGCSKTGQDFPQESFRAPSRHIWRTAGRFLALRKILLTGKLFLYGFISSRFFLSGKLFPFLTVRTRTNIFTQSAINRESALC